MSRPDLINSPHLANKLAEAQAKLAGSVAGRPGSHPHPRRLLKQAGEQVPPGNGNIFEQTTRVTAKRVRQRRKKDEAAPKPRNKRRRKQKDKHPATRERPTEASDRGGVINEAGGEADTGRGIHQGKETKIEPCEKCQTNEECDGGPFCGCDCHD